MRIPILPATLLGTALALACAGACKPDAPSASGRPGPGLPIQERFDGTVEEVLPAGSYTYFRLRVAEGDERWVVISGRTDREAERLAVATFSHHEDFVSKRLARSFHNLYFGAVAHEE